MSSREKPLIMSDARHRALQVGRFTSFLRVWME